MSRADKIRSPETPTFPVLSQNQDVLSSRFSNHVIIIHKDILYPQPISTLYTHRSFILLTIYYISINYLSIIHQVCYKQLMHRQSEVRKPAKL